MPPCPWNPTVLILKEGQKEEGQGGHILQDTLMHCMRKWPRGPYMYSKL